MLNARPIVLKKGGGGGGGLSHPFHRIYIYCILQYLAFNYPYLVNV